MRFLTKMENGEGENLKAKFCRDFIDNTKLIDLGAVGQKFTWNNKREGWAHVKERRDRAVGNIK